MLSSRIQLFLRAVGWRISITLPMSQPVDTSRLGAQAGREHVAKRESAPSHDTRRVTLTTYMKEMSPYLGNANTASPLRPKT